MSDEDSGSPHRKIRRPLLLLSLAIGTALGVTSLWLATTPPPPPAIREASEWIGGALGADEAAPYSELWPQLVARRAVLPRSLVHLQAGQEGPDPLHQSFQRTYFLPEPPLEPPPGFGGASLESVYPGPLPEGGPVLTYVGVWVLGPPEVGGVAFEVLAYSESQRPEGARWIFGPPRARSLHAGSLRARRAAGQVFQPPR